MDETTKPAPQGEMQTGTDPKPEIGTTSVTGEMSGTTTTTQSESSDDLKRELETIRAALKKANSEAAGHRKKAEELDKLKADQEAATLSETQKLQKQLAKLQADHDNALRTSQERIINYEVRLQAAQAGIIDPDAASKLLDWSAIEYDDNGQPTNVPKLLADLLKAKPYLAGNTKPSITGGNATNPPRSQSTGPQALSWDVISKMTREEYESRRSEIQQWINTHPFKYGQK